MLKLITLSTFLAIAAARPGLISTGIVAPYAQLATPLAYSGQLNPIGYAGLAAPVAVSAPVAYSAPVEVTAPVAVASPVAVSAPVVKSAEPVAVAAPVVKTISPVAYSTRIQVGVASAPVEQHGYQIVY